MPVWKNVFEVLRRGVWSNLTGGWYYDPANAMFSNILAMYLFLYLFVFPLLVGLFSAQRSAISIIYVCSVTIVFALIKLCVYQLHRLFDTTDPIVVYKTRSPSRQGARELGGAGNRTPMSSFSATRATESNAMVDMIEMLEMSSRRGVPPPQPPDRSPPSLPPPHSSSHHQFVQLQTKNLLDETSSSSTTSSASSSSESSSTTSSSPSSSDDEGEKRGSSIVPRKTAITVDLEKGILKRGAMMENREKPLPGHPIDSEDEEEKDGDYTSIKEEEAEEQQPSPKLRERKVSDAEDDEIVGGSSNEPCCSKALLEENIEHGQSSLTPERKKTKKSSFKIVDAHHQKLPNEVEKAAATSLMAAASGRGGGEPPNSALRDQIRRFLEELIAQHPETTLDAIESLLSTHQKQPCSVGGGGGASSSTTTKLSEEREVEMDQEKDDREKVVDDEKTDSECETKDRKTSSKKVPSKIHQKKGFSPQSEDFDVEKGTPLEEEFDESGSLSQSDAEEDGREKMLLSSSPPTPKSTPVVASCGGGGIGGGLHHHMALSHHDTSQGAVHTFQDERGNWFTYSFDENGSGVAQLLGCSDQLSDLISVHHQQQQQKKKGAKIRGNKSKLAVEKPKKEKEQKMPQEGEESDFYENDDGKSSDSDGVDHRKLTADHPRKVVVLVEEKEAEEKKSEKQQRKKQRKRPGILMEDGKDRNLSGGEEIFPSPFHGPHRPRHHQPTVVKIIDAHTAQRRLLTSTAPMEEGGDNNIVVVADDRSEHRGKRQLKSRSVKQPSSFSSSESEEKGEELHGLRKGGPQQKADDGRTLSDDSDEGSSSSSGTRSARRYLPSKPTAIIAPISASSGAAGTGTSSSSRGQQLSMGAAPFCLFDRRNRQQRRRAGGDFPRRFSFEEEDGEGEGENDERDFCRTPVFRHLPTPPLPQLPPPPQQLPRFDTAVETGRQLVSMVNRMRRAGGGRTISFTPAVPPEEREMVREQLALRAASHDTSAMGGGIISSSSSTIPQTGAGGDGRFRRWGAEVIQGFASSLNPPAPSLDAIRLFASLQSAYRGTHGGGGIQLPLDAHQQLQQQSAASKTKQYYSLKSVFPFSLWRKGPKVEINRLSLASLFDRNFFPHSILFDIGLATLIALLAAAILSRHIFVELSVPLFAFVTAGAHFSLLKSVQPDAASPVHGFNWLTAYSRPAYFCALAGTLLALDSFGFSATMWHFSPPWLRTFTRVGLAVWPRDAVACVLISLPLVHTLGLLPQINTMALYLVEQIDMHMFGATASVSLRSAVGSLFRSVVCVATLVGAASVSRLFQHHHHHHHRNQNSSSSAEFALEMIGVLYAILVIQLSYFASRLSTNSSSGGYKSARSGGIFASIWRQFRRIFSSPPASEDEGPEDKHEKGRGKGKKRKGGSHRRSCSISEREGTDSATRQQKQSLLRQCFSSSSKKRQEKEESELEQQQKEGEDEGKPDRLNAPVESSSSKTKQQTNKKKGSGCGAAPDDERKPSSSSGGKKQQQQKHHRRRRHRRRSSNRRRGSCSSSSNNNWTQRRVLRTRLRGDLARVLFSSFLFVGIHFTSVFTTAMPIIQNILGFVAVGIGFLNHYLLPRMRSRYPWNVFSRPMIKSHEFGVFETNRAAKLTRFERIYIWLQSIEKNMILPLFFLSVLLPWPLPSPSTLISTVLLSVVAFRCSRTANAQPQLLHVPLLLTALYFRTQFGYFFAPPSMEIASKSSPPFQFFSVLFIAMICWSKFLEFWLKINFIACYIAPWQISWGSAFHAFAQPFSLPHTGCMLAQAAISSVFSAPLNPFLGSSFFLTSYVRPVKFWERDYNTRRLDNSNMRLAAQIDRLPMMDDSNLNSIFYEHLTSSLQRSLAGDVAFGRWATTVDPGDCFILASNSLNCLVHVVEVGNGFLTFQLRGLEFRGTYCHQREVEAISEDLPDTRNCCQTFCPLPNLLSFGNIWTLSWTAWSLTTAKYIVDGYSIADNSAVNLFQVHELRRLLITLYVKCIIYFALRSPKFDEWLTNEAILRALEQFQQSKGRSNKIGASSTATYVDKDPAFSAVNDEDFDLKHMGVTREHFLKFYGDWIDYCLRNNNNVWQRRSSHSHHHSHSQQQQQQQSSSSTTAAALTGLLSTAYCGEPPPVETVHSFLFLLSLLGRRALGSAAYNRHANAAESFLFGLHTLFNGDVRVSDSDSEWVFTDPDILSTVISRSIRLALKLHQDHFIIMDDFSEPSALLERILSYQSGIFISHEYDPGWRDAILQNTPSLLALRHVFQDGQDDYKIIQLNKMHLNMRIIKLNRESVRAFWAGQQQELIFLRNRNTERGSIQNARQVLRNMINSSADQPIGYPIYVSPLTTSYVEQHPQFSNSSRKGASKSRTCAGAFFLTLSSVDICVFVWRAIFGGVRRVARRIRQLTMSGILRPGGGGGGPGGGDSLTVQFSKLAGMATAMHQQQQQQQISSASAASSRAGPAPTALPPPPSSTGQEHQNLPAPKQTIPAVQEQQEKLTNNDEMKELPPSAPAGNDHQLSFPPPGGVGGEESRVAADPHRPKHFHRRQMLFPLEKSTSDPFLFSGGGGEGDEVIRRSSLFDERRRN